ncbi:hypothetical protein F3Y22_tig00111059pilonHSYRG00235 [Hibiscus syriacus]|uniref:DUF1731 domain-containing protein n=1 Tax=Hibiscus syriacus TaxID=106335 RepID=A0A6A2Z4A4_HIBSY|nr:hypothetical protein F3Y22_tig00111059pilonHSYRG00235 [Hibiscus syriacus]
MSLSSRCLPEDLWVPESNGMLSSLRTDLSAFDIFMLCRGIFRPARIAFTYRRFDHVSYIGVINGTAPTPVRLSELCSQLGNAMGRPSWLTVPDFALKAVLGEGATVVLEGQKVLPVKAKELGFPFKCPYVKDALESILK